LKLRLVNIFVFALFFSNLKAQRADIWAFGWNTGLDFKTDPPTLFFPTIQHNCQLYYGTSYPQLLNNPSTSSASITDCQGNLLFYASDCQVRNRLYQPMPDGCLANDCNYGDPAEWYGGLQNEVLIIPKPGSSNIYYIAYSVTHYPTYNSPNLFKGLYYSEVDMTLDSGLGNINSIKNRRFSKFPSSGFIFIPHSNNKDFWVISKPTSDSFYAFKVTSIGIDSVPIKSYGLGDMYQGQIKATHDNKQIISTDISSSQSLFSAFIFDFNRSTGIISNPKPLLRQIQHLNKTTWAIETSPNDSLIYLTTPNIWGVTNSNSGLIQVERFASDIPSTFVFIKRGLALPGLQIGPDNKIYVANNTYYPENIGVIHYPNKKGLACNFNPTQYSLTTMNLNGANMPNLYLPIYNIAFKTISEPNNCFKDSVRFINLSDTHYKSFIWVFGDGDSLYVTGKQSVAHKYQSNGKYYVKLLGKSNTYNQCYAESRFSDTITVHYKPQPKIHWDSLKIQCLSQKPYFTDSTNNILLTVWDWGDKTKKDTGKVQSHIYDSSGTYNISMIVTNQYCIDTGKYILPVTINKIPKNGFTVNDTIGCSPLTIRFIDTSLYSLTRYWDFGKGGLTVQRNNPLPDTLYQTYTNVGKYQIRLVTSNNQGCYDSTYQTVYVIDPSISKFIVKTQNYCNYTRLICNNQSQFADSFTWLLDTGTKTANFKAKDSIFYDYYKSGNYLLSLVAKNQYCQDSAGSMIPITVNYKPIADFSISDSLDCQPLTTKFFDKSINSMNYSVFEFGDGTKDSVFVGGQLQKIYTNAGIFNVKSTVHNAIAGCKDSTSKKVIVKPKPIKPTVGNNSPLCEGAELQLNALSDIGSSYLWNADNGFSSSLQNPIIIDVKMNNSGNYTVKSTLNNCESDTATTQVIIYHNPVVNIGKDTSVCSWDTIVLDPGLFTSYLWQDYSTNRTFGLSDPGFYWVVVTDNHGCSASDSITVIKLCPSVLYIPNSFSPNGDGYNDVFQIASENVIGYNIKIYNRWGELVYQNNDINTGWDGKTKGTDCPSGYYYITLSVQFIDNMIKYYNSSILLLR